MTGQDLKTEGQARVSRSNWTQLAAALFVIWADACKEGGWVEIRMEQFRAYMREQPHHPNAWGALTTMLARRGYIEWSGLYVQAQSEKTHAHPVKLWRLL